MARVLGESGRYSSDKLSKERRKILLVLLLSVCGLSFIAGMFMCGLFPLGWANNLVKIFLSVTAIIGIVLLDKWGNKKVGAMEKERDKQARGLAGEQITANTLSRLPDDFYVINNLSTPSGDLDHVVVGPTGVFVLDTKAWRGIVAADGRGELLLNGNPTDKPYIRQFVGRMMGVREKMLVHLPGLDIHFSAVFVFTAARVEARWGTTGKLNCVTDDQIYSYIVEKDFGRKLPPEEVQKIAQTFLGLAHMDADFTKKA